MIFFCSPTDQRDRLRVRIGSRAAAHRALAVFDWGSSYRREEDRSRNPLVIGENPLGIAPVEEPLRQSAGRRPPQRLDLHHCSLVRPLGSSELAFDPRQSSRDIGEKPRIIGAGGIGGAGGGSSGSGFSPTPTLLAAMKASASPANVPRRDHPSSAIGLSATTRPLASTRTWRLISL
jgi:hypothetical protein